MLPGISRAKLLGSVLDTTFDIVYQNLFDIARGLSCQTVGRSTLLLLPPLMRLKLKMERIVWSRLIDLIDAPLDRGRLSAIHELASRGCGSCCVHCICSILSIHRRKEASRAR